MEQPLISIVMPTYNVERYLERCLLSIINQDFINFEILIVDDCGNDKSIDIARQYSQIDSRIKVLENKKNLGTFHARKRGAFAASGEFILFLDPDDELSNHALTTIHSYLIQYPDIDLLLFDIEVLPKRKNNLKSVVWHSLNRFPEGIFEGKSLSNILKYRSLLYGTPGKLYSKKSVTAAYEYLSIPNVYRLVYGEDVLLFTSVLLHSQLAVSINRKLYLYYQNASSITMLNSRDQLIKNIEQLKIVKKKLQFLSNHANYNKNYEIILNKIKVRIIWLEKEIATNEKEYMEKMLQLFYNTRSLEIAKEIGLHYLKLLKSRN